MTKWINQLQASIIQLMIIIQLQAVKNTLHLKRVRAGESSSLNLTAAAARQHRREP